MRKINLGLIIIMLLFILGACSNNSTKKENVVDEDGNPIGTIEDQDQITYDDIINHMETPKDQFEYGPCNGGIELRKYLGTDPIVVIPNEIDGEKVVLIPSYAFFNSTVIKGIKFPDGIFTVEEGAFFCAKMLQMVVAENTELILEKSAFDGCISLREFYTGDSLKRIGKWSFGACYLLESIYIPNTIESIDETAFIDARKVVLLGEKDSYAQKYVEERQQYVKEFQEKKPGEKIGYENIKFQEVE